MQRQKSLLLDTRWYSHNPTGVGKYVYQTILSCLQHKHIQTTLLGAKDGDKYLPSHIKHIPLLGLKKRILQGLWKTISYPKLETLFGSYGLVHFTNATAIPHYNTAYILTVHDLAWVDFPNTIEPKNLRFLQKYVPSSIENAKHIIAVSDHTKNKIVKHFNISPQRITTIYNGVDDVFFEPQDRNHVQKILKKYHIKNSYIFSSSTIEPRKDFMTQILAYKKLPKSIRKTYDLVIAGAHGWGCDQIITEAKKPLDVGHIHLLGYIDSEDVVPLMQAANMYLHTSLDEGFGMGPLQALAAKTPVIASHTSCHPEILKQYARYFEVANSDDLASTIEQELEAFTIDVDEAYEYARKFSWQAMRQKHILLYSKCIS